MSVGVKCCWGAVSSSSSAEKKIIAFATDGAVLTGSRTDAVRLVDRAAIARLLAHTRILSSDVFEGRAPGTHGETLTVAYIAAQMRALGLQPGGADGTFLQPVPLVGLRSVLRSACCGGVTLAPGEEVVAWSRHPQTDVRIDGAEMVFAGYGVCAPEYDWDDFKDVDLRGRTVVVRVGDPPVADPRDPSRRDPATFNGEALTWHGRWTRKLEQAALRGATAVLVVHDTEGAGYPWSVVQARAPEALDRRDAHAQRCPIEGWLSEGAARRVFAAAGVDLDALTRAAVSRDFRPVALGALSLLHVTNEVRRFASSNVVGVLPGSDECVLYTAHWDHLGVGLPVDGDTVRHGARDNAAAVASLLEAARLFTSVARPRRTLVFLATTAEEQGLLGAEHYALHPLVPLPRTLAVLNFEMPNVYGRTRDLIVYGRGLSELDGYAARAAAAQGRHLADDPNPSQGLYFRSDHFPFAQHGVPAMWAGGGTDCIDHPPGHAARMQADYVAHRYHSPADRVTDDWDLLGALEDLMVYVEMGRAISAAARPPQWTQAGAAFAAARAR